MNLLLTTLLLAQQGPNPEQMVGGVVGLICVGVMFLFAIAVTAFWVWMLVDCIQNEPNHPDNQFVVWLILLLLLTWIGALVYYFVRKRGRR